MSSLPSNELSSCNGSNNKDNHDNNTGTNHQMSHIIVGRRPRKWLSSSTSSLFSALSIAAPSSQCTASTQQTNSRSTATSASSNIGTLGAPYNNIYPPPVRFTQTYEILEQVDGGQKGVHSTVWLAMDKLSSDYVAVKIVPRANLSPADDRAVFDEVATLKKLNSASAILNHPRSAKIPNWNDGVLTLLDFFVTMECFFIVTEYLDGGDLWEQLEKRGRFREVEAKGIVKSLLRTVRFIHSNNVCHRDIKPENILVGTVVTKRSTKSTTTNNNKRVQQKIILADFGLSTTVEKTKSLLGRCGTPMYAAPEVLMGRPYDYSCDMWSIGVLVYLFLSGCPPFFDNNKHRLYEQIISGSYHFCHEGWNQISPEAKDFIQCCLTLNPDDRITADESLRHKWFKSSN